MEEDEGLLEIALDYWDDESILADGQSGDGVVQGGGGKGVGYEHGGEEPEYEHGGEMLVYEHGRELGGYNDHGMEVQPRYDPGYKCCAPPCRAPEFFQTLPTLAPSARGLQGSSGTYHAAVPGHSRTPLGSGIPNPHHYALEPCQALNAAGCAPSMPRDAQHMEHCHVPSLSRDVPMMHQGTGVPAQSNAKAGPSRIAAAAPLPSRPPQQQQYSQSESFFRLAQSLHQEKQEGVTYYKRKDL